MPIGKRFRIGLFVAVPVMLVIVVATFLWDGNGNSSGASLSPGASEARETIGLCLQKATLTAESISDAKEKDEFLSGLAHALADAGRHKNALGVAQLIGERATKESSLRDIAVSQAGLGDTKGALTTSDLIDGKENRAYCLDEMVKALVGKGRIADAAEIIPKIGEPSTDISALLAFAVAQAKAKDSAGSKKSFGEAIEIDRTNGRKSLSSIAKAQAEAGMFEAAIATASSQNPDSFVQSEGLSQIALVQAKTGDVSGSKRTFGLAISAVPARSLTGQFDDPSAALTMIAFDQAQAGFSREAMETISKIKNADKDLAIGKVVRGQTLAGDAKAARQTIGMVQSVELKADGWTDIAKCYLKVGDKSGSREAWKQALLLAESFSPEQPRGKGNWSKKDWLFRTIADQQLEAMELLGAAETVKLIEDSAEKETYLHYITERQAESLAKAGRLNEALSLVSQAGTAQDLRSVFSTYASIASDKDIMAGLSSLKKPQEQAYGYLGAAEGLIVRYPKSIQTAMSKTSSDKAQSPSGESGKGGASDDKSLVLDLGNNVTMKLALIPAGKFLMGSPKDEKNREDDEGPQHEVTISKPFYMGVYEVTRGQFAAFVNDSGYKTNAEKEGKGWGWGGSKFAEMSDCSWRKNGFTQGDDHPVVNVSWDDAVEFCKWLSKKTGKKVSLPTEAQWEYACRAGSKTTYPWGDTPEDGKGWCNATDQAAKKIFGGEGNYFSWDDGYAFTSPAGKFKANAFGLYDMIGNAWEWCSDWHGSDYYSANASDRDPQGPAFGPFRILRGGSWCCLTRDCRSAKRHSDSQMNASYDFGFRVILDLK